MFRPMPQYEGASGLRSDTDVALAEVQMRSLGADVVRFDDAVPGHFPLHGEVPLLVLRIVVLGRRRPGAASEGAQ